jgi:hypothetical protein
MIQQNFVEPVFTLKFLGKIFFSEEKFWCRKLQSKFIERKQIFSHPRKAWPCHYRPIAKFPMVARPPAFSPP